MPGMLLGDADVADLVPVLSKEMLLSSKGGEGQTAHLPRHSEL